LAIDVTALETCSLLRPLCTGTAGKLAVVLAEKVGVEVPVTAAVTISAVRSVLPGTVRVKVHCDVA
jgi:hypothetical protein